MDYDLDSACFPLKTSEVLLWFTGPVIIHLMNTPNNFRELSHLVFVGDMGWKVFLKLRLKQKAQVCHTISSHGQLVFPSKSTKCFIRGRCLIPLEVLIMALEAVKIDQIAFYAYGMKAEDSHQFLHSYRQLPDSAIAQCRWDFGF